MSNTSQNQYIELGNRVVDKINDFKILKKENQKLHLDLNNYKSVVIKERKLIEKFKGIKNDLIRVIKNKEFDIKKLNYNLAELKEVDNGISKITNQSNTIKNNIPKYDCVLNGYKKNVGQNENLVNSCISEMELADLHKYIGEINNQTTKNNSTLKNQELIISNSSVISLFNVVQKNLAELVKLGKFDYQKGKTILDNLTILKKRNIKISEQRDNISQNINKYSIVFKGYEKQIKEINNFLKFCETELSYEKLNNSNSQVNEIINKNSIILKDTELVLKNQKLISDFQGVQNDFSYIVSNNQFDKNIANKVFKNLEKINSQFQTINKNSNKLNEISTGYNKITKSASKLIQACKAQMKISEIEEYIEKFNSIISELNLHLSGTKDKFSRLSDLLSNLDYTKKAWKEDCETLLVKVRSAIDELKKHDIDIENLFSELSRIEKKKKTDIKYLKEKLTGNTYNNFESQITELKQSQSSYSDYEYLKSTINQYIYNQNSKITQKVNKEKAKIIGYGILGLVGLFLFFTFKWYFIVLAILVGAGMFLINFTKTEDNNFDLFENMMTGLYIAGGVLVVGSIISAIWWSWVIFISIFFVLFFGGLFTVFLIVTKEIMEKIEISLEKQV